MHMLKWPLTRVQVATTQKVTYDHNILSSTSLTSSLCISIIFALCFHQFKVNFAQSVQSHQKCILHIKHMSILKATCIGILTKVWGTQIYDCMSDSAKWPLARVQVTTFTKSSDDLLSSLSTTFKASWWENSKKFKLVVLKVLKIIENLSKRGCFWKPFWGHLKRAITWNTH